MTITGWTDLPRQGDINDPFGIERALRALPEESRASFTADWGQMVESSGFDISRLYTALSQRAMRGATTSSDDVVASAWREVFVATSRYLANAGLALEIADWLAEPSRGTEPPRRQMPEG